MSKPFLSTGRHTRLAHVPTADGGVGHHDLPVFDKSRSVSLRAEDRVGLVHTAGGKFRFFGFRVTDKDKRPAKPVPFHEPDPDRFAKSAARLAMIQKADARRAQQSASYVEEIVNRPPVKSAGARAVPVVEEPDLSTCCPPEEAQVKGERNGRVVYYPTVLTAELAFGGTKTAQRIKNAVTPNGRLRDPYGWKWTLLIDRRNGGHRLAQP